MHGNQLRTVAPELGQLSNLQELCLQGNQLTHIPHQLTQLTVMSIDSSLPFCSGQDIEAFADHPLD